MPAAKKPMSASDSDQEAPDAPMGHDDPQEAPAAAPGPPGRACVNCGLPATKQTASPGIRVQYLCDNCAAQVYPAGTMPLEDISAPSQ